MRAALFREFGPPEVLHVEEWPDPGDPGPGEVVVRVHAVSIGRLLDLGTRAGTNRYFAGTLPHILGGEHTGDVVAVGEGVDHVRPGDRVAVFNVLTCGTCDFCRRGHDDACPAMKFIGVHVQGAYAEYTKVPAVNVTRLPEATGYFEGAAMALAGPVGWTQMTMAGVGPGSWVLVNAAGSGLGSMTAIVAKHMGARVIGTSRMVWKRGALVGLGLDAAFDAYAPDFVERVRELTDGVGVDVVVENISAAEIFPALLGTLARRGALISSGAFIGQTLPLDLRSLYQQSQRLIGVKTATKAHVAEFWREVAPHVKPVLDRSFPLAEAAAAHRHMEASDNLGRVALTPA